MPLQRGRSFQTVSEHPISPAPLPERFLLVTSPPSKPVNLGAIMSRAWLAVGLTASSGAVSVVNPRYLSRHVVWSSHLQVRRESRSLRSGLLKKPSGGDPHLLPSRRSHWLGLCETSSEVFARSSSDRVNCRDRAPVLPSLLARPCRFLCLCLRPRAGSRRC